MSGETAAVVRGRVYGTVQLRHTERGTHRVDTVPFPDWVPASVLAAARHLDEPDACASLTVVLDCAHG